MASPQAPLEKIIETGFFSLSLFSFIVKFYMGATVWL